VALQLDTEIAPARVPRLAQQLSVLVTGGALLLHLGAAFLDTGRLTLFFGGHLTLFIGPLWMIAGAVSFLGLAMNYRRPWYPLGALAVAIGGVFVAQRL
jgi:hypothetical protein